MPNLLKNTRIYLSGSIDNSPDAGIIWRREFAEKAKHLNLNIIDPTCKPGNAISETQKEKDIVQQLKERKNWDELTKFAKKIRRWDLRAVDYSHAIVCYIDPPVAILGTVDEVLTAEDQQKPIFIITKDKAKLPMWFFAMVDHNEIFSSIDECIHHLELIDQGLWELDNRWVIL